jgi:hypothetical protein
MYKPSLRSLAVASAFALTLLAVTGVAIAAHPLKGVTYTGKLKLPVALVEPISFKVTANGKRVHDFVVTDLPIGCQGGAFGTPQPGSALVSKEGAFKATLKLYFAPLHRVTGKLVITGTFLPHGKEKGKVTTVFTNRNYSTSCDKTVGYATVG